MVITFVVLESTRGFIVCFFLFGRFDSMCLKQGVTYWCEGCDANFILSYTILEPIGMKVVALSLF